MALIRVNIQYSLRRARPEKPTEEKVVPQLTNEEQKTQSQRRLIKSLLWIGVIVGLALLGYIIYQSAMLLM